MSGLSPRLRHRLVTEAEVIDATLRAHPRGADKFLAEVWWRTYWKGWLELRPGIWSADLQGLQTALNRLAVEPGPAARAGGRDVGPGLAQPAFGGKGGPGARIPAGPGPATGGDCRVQRCGGAIPLAVAPAVHRFTPSALADAPGRLGASGAAVPATAEAVMG